MYRILVCERFSFQGNKVHFFEKKKLKVYVQLTKQDLNH